MSSDEEVPRISIPCKDSRTSAGPCASTTSSCRYSQHPSSSDRKRQTYFFLVGTCSANTSTQYFALNSRMKRGSQSSLAMPRSLQHRISALLFTASVAVGMPLGSKYSCSPRATATSLMECCQDRTEMQCKSNAPSEAHKRILSAHNLGSHVRLASRCKTPSSRSEGPVEHATILDLRQVYQSVCTLPGSANSTRSLTRVIHTRLHLDIQRVNGREQNIGNFLRERLRRQPMVALRPVCAVRQAVRIERVDRAI